MSAYADKPNFRSLFEHEDSAEDLSDGVEPDFAAHKLATRLQSRSRGATHRVPSPTEDMPNDVNVAAARNGFASRGTRRRAWVDPESEGSPSSGSHNEYQSRIRR